MLLNYDLKEAVTFAYKATLAVARKPATGSGRKGSEHNVGRTSETNKKNRTNKRYKPSE